MISLSEAWVDLNIPCPKCKKPTLRGYMSTVRSAHSSTGKQTMGLRSVACSNCSYKESPKGNDNDK